MKYLVAIFLWMLGLLLVSSRVMNAQGNAAYQVNSGGQAVSPFSADSNFTGGTAYSFSTTVDTSGVTDPAPAAVYQSLRYDTNQFSYTLPGLTAGGSYNVRLHFVEVSYATAGQRPFNVTINGVQVLTDFDPFTAAG